MVKDVMKSLSFAFFAISYFVFTRIYCDVRSKYVGRVNNGVDLMKSFGGDLRNATQEVGIFRKEEERKEIGKKCLEDVEGCRVRDPVYQKTLNHLSKYLFSALPQIDISSSTSLKCSQDFKKYQQDLKKFKLWALKMYDANAKLPSGILSGNLNQLGDFDLCLSVAEEDVRGKYCLAELEIDIPRSSYLSALHKLIHAHYAFRSKLEDPGHRVPRFSSLQWAICAPASCSSLDVKRAFEDSLKEGLKGTDISFRIKLDETMCQTDRSEPLPKSTIIVGSFFALIAAVTIIATLYDCSSETNNEYLLAFSLKKNGSKLISTERTDNDIKAAHGIRFVNAFMLLIAHKCMAIFFTPYINRTPMSELIGQPWTVLGRAASLYTDPFIMLSGLLTTHSYLGRLEKTNKINVLQEYISRMLRIVPTLAALILFCTYILPFIDSGPLWNIVISHYADICKRNWWRNFLFIHNYFGFRDMCLTHTHHIGIDTQLFFVSPIFVLLIWKWPKKGTISLVAIALFSTCMRYYVTHVKRLSNYVHFGTSIQQLFDTADNMYILPAHRLTVYIMGVLIAYLLKKHKTLQLTKFQLQVGNQMAFLSFLLAFFGPSFMGNIDYVYNPTHAACYAAFAPILWCFTFGWIIFTSHLGYENILSKFFSWKIFLIWTRISYTVYLTQFPIFFYNVGTTRHSGFYQVLPTTVNLSEFGCIVAFSVLMTLLFEMPFQNIRNIIFKSSKSLQVRENWKKTPKVS